MKKNAKNLNVSKNNTIESQWLDVKSKFDNGNYDLNEIDNLTYDLLDKLGELTLKGYIEINSVSIDRMKTRVWGLIERAGLLPEHVEEY